MKDLWRREVERIGARVDGPDGLRRLLQRHVPAPYRVAGGTIVDRRGWRSAPVAAAVLSPSHPFTVEGGAADALLFADGVVAAVLHEPTAGTVASVKALERAPAESPGGVIIGGGEAPSSIPCIAVVSSGPAEPAPDASPGAPDVVAVLGRGLRGQVTVDAGEATLAILLALLPGLLGAHPASFADYGRLLDLEVDVAASASASASAPAFPAPPGLPGLPGFLAAEAEAAEREVAAARAEAERIIAAARIEAERSEAAGRAGASRARPGASPDDEAEAEPPPFV